MFVHPAAKWQKSAITYRYARSQSKGVAVCKLLCPIRDAVVRMAASTVQSDLTNYAPTLNSLQHAASTVKSAPANFAPTNFGPTSDFPQSMANAASTVQSDPTNSAPTNFAQTLDSSQHKATSNMCTPMTNPGPHMGLATQHLQTGTAHSLCSPMAWKHTSLDKKSSYCEAPASVVSGIVQGAGMSPHPQHSVRRSPHPMGRRKIANSKVGVVLMNSSAIMETMRGGSSNPHGPRALGHVDCYDTSVLFKVKRAAGGGSKHGHKKEEAQDEENDTSVLFELKREARGGSKQGRKKREEQDGENDPLIDAPHVDCYDTSVLFKVNREAGGGSKHRRKKGEAQDEENELLVSSPQRNTVLHADSGQSETVLLVGSGQSTAVLLANSEQSKVYGFDINTRHS
eukprot:gene32126-16648_t